MLYEVITESYPVGIILSAIGLTAICVTALMTNKIPLYRSWLLSRTPARSRYTVMLPLLVLPVLAAAYVSEKTMPEFRNNFV